MRRTLRRPARAGFTAIEMLVVFFVIAILVSLLLGGVQAARASSLRTQARTDINEFSSALNAYNAKTNNRPLPSRVVLFENISDYFTTTAQANPDAMATYDALNALFGPQGGPVPPADAAQRDDRLPDGRLEQRRHHQPARRVRDVGGGGGPGVLDRWHPVAPGQIPACLGFNMSGPNPASNPQKLSFNFNLNRLSRNIANTGNPNAVSNFMVYSDPWGSPYAYFATHNSQNNYPYYDPTNFPNLQNDYVNRWSGRPSCPTTPRSITPRNRPRLRSSTRRRSRSCRRAQISTFAAGGLWSPQSGVTGGSGSPDYDNISNFTAGIVGGGQ